MSGPGQLRRAYKRAGRNQEKVGRSAVMAAGRTTQSMRGREPKPDSALIRSRIHDLAIAALIDEAHRIAHEQA